MQLTITGSAVTAVDLNTGPVAWMNHCVFLVLYPTANLFLFHYSAGRREKLLNNYSYHFNCLIGTDGNVIPASIAYFSIYDSFAGT
jgi:hypothetical protein